jgi:nicotinamide-nucleotide amidase
MNYAKTLINFLLANGLTMSAAESCTGGYLSYLLTQTPGSSHVFKGAVVVYSLEAKQQFFSLPKALLETTQGVSGQVVRLLAQNCRKIFKTYFAVSIVGVAGPKSVKNFKPGTVFIAIATSKKTIVKKFIFKGTRDMVRKAAAKKAIGLLCGRLLP